MILFLHSYIKIITWRLQTITSGERMILNKAHRDSRMFASNGVTKLRRDFGERSNTRN